MVLLDDEARREHGRVAHQLRIVVDRSAEHVERLERRHPFLDRASRDGDLQQRGQLLAIRETVRARGEARVVRQLGPAGRRAKGPPRVVLPHREKDPPVARVERLVRHEIRVPAPIAADRHAGLVEDRQPRKVREERPVEQRDVHALPLARPAARDQRRENALRREQAADGVDHVRSDQRRTALGLAGHGHDAADGLRERVEPGLVAPRPVGPERRQGAVDEPGIERPERRVVDAELLGHAVAVALEHDIRGSHQAIEGFAAQGVPEIDAEGALVAVDGEMQDALARAGYAVDRSGRVRRLTRLDLDDVGSHVGQVHAARGPGDEMRQLQDAHALERSSRGGSHGRHNLPQHRSPGTRTSHLNESEAQR